MPRNGKLKNREENKMDNKVSNSVDIQNTIDNFEAVIASGDVKLIDQTGEVKLYRGQDGIEYIYDGSNAFSQLSAEFAQIKARNFGGTAAG
jgi:hypothetical protein